MKLYQKVKPLEKEKKTIVLSDKLIEQYELCLKEKDEAIALLQEKK